MIKKAKRLTNAIIRWQKAGRPVRSESEIQRIFDQGCRPCNHFNNKSETCNICGCRLRRNGKRFLNKIRMATEDCPEHKWGEPMVNTEGQVKHRSDHARLRHARECNKGFSVGRYIQTPPMFFTRDGHTVPLADMYRGRSMFLVCGGPSLRDMPLEKLDQRGIITMSVNNAATVFRPNLWTSVDDPAHFCDAIWRDPAITKFVPLCHMEKPVWTRDEQNKLVPSGLTVGDMPAVLGFRRNEYFQPDQWLYEDTFNWGNHKNYKDGFGKKGSRSVFYIALRLAFYLGIRRLFLVGCDFRMESDKQNYAFEQDRTESSIRSNNSSYKIMNQRLKLLLPHFEREGFEVYNCTPRSGLNAFPKYDFLKAVDQATAEMPTGIITTGLYDGAAKT